MASLFSGGVSEFMVVDIDGIYANDPTAFPIQLAFNTETASFRMSLLDENETESIPEPSTVVSLLLISISGGIFLKPKK